MMTYKPVVVLAFIVAGTLLSALYIAAILLLDRVVRRPLLKFMRLA